MVGKLRNDFPLLLISFMGPKKEGQTCVLDPRLVVPNPEHLKWKSNSIGGIILIMRPSQSQPISKENSDLETQSDAIYSPPCLVNIPFFPL